MIILLIIYICRRFSAQRHFLYTGTVKGKIESEKYSAIEEIAADIRLVFTNCMLYNKDGSEVGKRVCYVSRSSG